jgi:carbon starvation protein CstA
MILLTQVQDLCSLQVVNLFFHNTADILQTVTTNIIAFVTGVLHRELPALHLKFGVVVAVAQVHVAANRANQADRVLMLRKQL